MCLEAVDQNITGFFKRGRISVYELAQKLLCIQVRRIFVILVYFFFLFASVRARVCIAPHTLLKITKNITNNNTYINT